MGVYVQDHNISAAFSHRLLKFVLNIAKTLAFYSMVKYAMYHICIICIFMNIYKNAKNMGYKRADFIPILSLLHVLI